jgi:hypothetical protein
MNITQASKLLLFNAEFKGVKIENLEFDDGNISYFIIDDPVRETPKKTCRLIEIAKNSCRS